MRPLDDESLASEALDTDWRPVAGLTCFCLAVILLGHAVGVVLFLDEATRDPALVRVQPDPDDAARSVMYWVANNIYPRAGTWGCVLFFAAPAIILVICGRCMLRRS